MTFRHSVMALLFSLTACTPVRPRVSLAPGVSLKGYEVFVVMPVTDRTGARFNLDMGIPCSSTSPSGCGPTI